ncbi:MAG: hypothetical protein A2096_03840, partial [Spirochaetes bacterium GWF1_41_5]
MVFQVIIIGMKQISRTILRRKLYRWTDYEKRRHASYNSVNYNLEAITEICRELGNPQNDFKSFHIAGTKGKGSTSFWLYTILKNKYSAGLYVSPHVIDERDRIISNDKKITWKEFCDVFYAVERAVKKTKTAPTFFDIVTACAFLYFSRKKIQYAVIETGLGGRLDSTNIIIPQASIITNISYEHTDKLGNTLARIAAEKAGIIKPGIPVFSGAGAPEARKVIKKTALEKNARVIETSPVTGSFSGDKFQKENILLAKTCAEYFGFFDNSCRLIMNNYLLPARFQKIKNFIIDGAHTPSAFAKLLASLPAGCDFLVFFLPDKDIETCIGMLPPKAAVYFIRLPLPWLSLDQKKIYYRISLVRPDAVFCYNYSDFKKKYYKKNKIYSVCGSF